MKKKNIIDDISLKMMFKPNDSLFCSDNDIISLIKELPDINMKGRDGRTLLIHSALYNRPRIIDFLIKKGADIELGDDLGITPLHASVIANNIEITKILLKNKARVNSLDAFGNTPLFRASHRQIDMIILLLKNGADSSIKNKFDISAYDTFMAYPNIISILDKYK